MWVGCLRDQFWPTATRLDDADGAETATFVPVEVTSESDARAATGTTAPLMEMKVAPRCGSHRTPTRTCSSGNHDGAAVGMITPPADVRIVLMAEPVDFRRGVPVLATGKTVTGWVWVYTRNDAPFGGDRPAALYKYSRDRKAEHPLEHLKDYAGILQAYNVSGYNELDLID